MQVALVLLDEASTEARRGHPRHSLDRMQGPSPLGEAATTPLLLPRHVARCQLCRSIQVRASRTVLHTERGGFAPSARQGTLRLNP